MSLPFKALIVPGTLALAGCLWWWYTSRSPKPETKDGTVSTVELSELTEKDEQCARSIATRAPVSDSLDEVQVIVESCEEIKQLQDPVTCQDEPEIVDIGQPAQSSQGVEELQEPLTCQDEPEIVDIGHPDQSCGGVEELQEPLTCQDKPEIVDISQPAQSSEGVEEIQDPSTCQDQPETVDKFMWEARLPKRLVGSFKGPRGWRLKGFMEKSGAKIDIMTAAEAGVPQDLVWSFGPPKVRHRIYKKSGVKIHLSPSSFEEFDIIRVDGNEEQIGTAAAMIMGWFKTCDLDLPFYTPRPVYYH